MRRAQDARHLLWILLRAALGLGHDLVDDAEGELLGRGQAHRHGRLLRVTPRCATGCSPRPPG